MVALAVGASAPASANTTLSLTGFGHMVVDSAHGHVFVSGSSSDSQIAVMNTNGTLDKMLTVGTGARGTGPRQLDQHALRGPLRCRRDRRGRYGGL